MKTVIDSRRGCGWREAGALYLRADVVFGPCGRLPVPLTVCPCCGEGVKQSRGFTWITNEILLGEDCDRADQSDCGECPLANENIPHKLGLLWVGGKFYPTPADFLNEANSQGISKRIAQIPKDLVLGKTLIALAHPRVQLRRPAMGDDPAACEGPGVCATFRADRIEYVVTGDETDEEIEALEARGVTPVIAEKSETGNLNFNPDPAQR